MDQVLRGLSFAYAYIDDVLIASTSPKEHTEHLRAVFNRLTTNGIVVNTNNCVLGVKELDFLKHHIDQNGITPLQSKVQAIHDFPQTNSQRQLQRFMGMINFYHRFIPHGAELLHPLHALINPKFKALDLNWDHNTSTTFLAAKQALANATLLVYPQSNAPICVMTYASDIAVGAVLQ